MNELQGWLFEQTNGGELSFAWCCCGNWDVKTQIPKQCQISGFVMCLCFGKDFCFNFCENSLNVPKMFNEWINLKDMYNAFTGQNNYYL